MINHTEGRWVALAVGLLLASSAVAQAENILIKGGRDE